MGIGTLDCMGRCRVMQRIGWSVACCEAAEGMMSGEVSSLSYKHIKLTLALRMPSGLTATKIATKQHILSV